MQHRASGPRPLAVAVTAVVVALLTSFMVAPAGAVPGDEGGTPALQQALDAASRGYVDAQAALDASRARHGELTARADAVAGQLAGKQEAAAVIATNAYRTGRLATAAAILDTSTPDALLRRTTMLSAVAAQNDRTIRELTRLRSELTEARTKVEAEVKLQEQQVSTMSAKKQEAERALATVGGEPTGGPTEEAAPAPAAPAPPVVKAAPPPPARASSAPRRPDGSWPRESCSRNDPTTSGCITPRTLHALQQAKAAGFTRFVSCFRPGGPYEHPKGRACDFAAQANGFGGVATGGDRSYGNNLAGYLVRNANALGVLYVIWFRQVWTPATGWRAYRSGRGDPSSDHTNHVHLSMY